MLERIKELSEALERILRLRTPPIGITLLKDVKEIPDDAHKPGRATVCQVTGIARYHGIAVGGEKGKVTCPMGATALGFSAAGRTGLCVPSLRVGWINFLASATGGSGLLTTITCPQALHLK